MESIGSIAVLFFLSVSLGMGLFSAFAIKEMGAGFIKLSMSVCAVPLLLALSFQVYGDQELITPLNISLAVGFISAVFTYFIHTDEKTPMTWFLYIVNNIAVILAHYFFAKESIGTFLFFLSSSLFLGAVNYAMIQGHWYLVNPKLSEVPLKKATIVIWVMLTLKVIGTVVGYFNTQEFFEYGTQIGAGYMFSWIMLMMRVGWGYFVVGVMSYFGWRLVCMRSIQSATGIFYAMTFFVFTGELIASFFFFKHGMFL